MAKVTTVPLTATVPNTLYQNVQQQLPNVIDVQSATSANVISAAQLAVSYCQSLLASRGTYFPRCELRAVSRRRRARCWAPAPGAGMDLIATPPDPEPHGTGCRVV